MTNTQPRHWAITLSSAVLLCGTLAAQSPTTSTPQPSTGATNGPTSATGCLQRGGGSSSSDSSATPPSGASASSAGGGSFVLKNVTFGNETSTTSRAPSRPGSEPPQAGTPPAGSPSSSNPSSTASSSSAASSSRSSGNTKELKLMADSGVNLSEHVGHQVTVMGRFSGGSGSAASSPSSSSSPSASTPSTPSSASSSSGPSGMASRGGTFTVTSVSMISATCPAGS